MNLGEANILIKKTFPHGWIQRAPKQFPGCFGFYEKNGDPSLKVMSSFWEPDGNISEQRIHELISERQLWWKENESLKTVCV